MWGAIGEVLTGVAAKVVPAMLKGVPGTVAATVGNDRSDEMRQLLRLLPARDTLPPDLDIAELAGTKLKYYDAWLAITNRTGSTISEMVLTVWVPQWLQQKDLTLPEYSALAKLVPIDERRSTITGNLRAMQARVVGLQAENGEANRIAYFSFLSKKSGSLAVNVECAVGGNVFSAIDTVWLSG